ncbi:hypothetical protein 8G_00066 [Ralstonia phage Hyacinthe]|uniref:Uncharacterized protein n=3 Tax=Rahariannevirus raharianne TaxID=2846050 RepID=A0A7G5BBA5_9CAUD|nr:hypothetical protein KMC43_gp09 [Ralstonia phage Raharianne]QMV32384.1 hypothetical protein U2_00009 [Ralstonia phage Albius]QMV33498.1 hypothetical protein 8G_00066 [Ralstonia phage Hyacinthe]QMV33578.1 hypothetical protein Y2_00009 [Ralstonia phage Raharianne]
MTDVRCVDCNKFSLRDDVAAALVGRGKCADEEIKSVRYDALRKKPCKKFAPALEQVADARVEWLKQKGIV